MGFDAALSQEESKAARLHSLIRNELEDYNLKSETEQNEVLVCEELGYRKIEGFGEVFIVGPNQIISTEGKTEIEDKLSKLEIIWTGSEDVEDTRIHGFPYPAMLLDFLSRLEKYHGTNSGSLYALLGYLYLSLHKRDLHWSNLNVPTFVLAGAMTTGKSTLVRQMTSILPLEFVDNMLRSALLSFIRFKICLTNVM